MQKALITLIVVLLLIGGGVGVVLLTRGTLPAVLQTGIMPLPSATLPLLLDDCQVLYQEGCMPDITRGTKQATLTSAVRTLARASNNTNLLTYTEQYTNQDLNGIFPANNFPPIEGGLDHDIATMIGYTSATTGVNYKLLIALSMLNNGWWNNPDALMSAPYGTSIHQTAFLQIMDTALSIQEYYRLDLGDGVTVREYDPADLSVVTAIKTYRFPSTMNQGSKAVYTHLAKITPTIATFEDWISTTSPQSLPQIWRDLFTEAASVNPIPVQERESQSAAIDAAAGILPSTSENPEEDPILEQTRK